MSKALKEELIEEIDKCLERNDISQIDFVNLNTLKFLLKPKDVHIGLLKSCAYMRNVGNLQHRTIHEFSQFIEDVMSNKEEYQAYQFDWNDSDAIETWIEKFHEYCKKEYKDLGFW